jgi:hypothetical protein
MFANGVNIAFFLSREYTCPFDKKVYIKNLWFFVLECLTNVENLQCY